MAGDSDEEGRVPRYCGAGGRANRAPGGAFLANAPLPWAARSGQLLPTMRSLHSCSALCLVAACAQLALAPPASPQATAYVPTLDPAYADLDALVASGLVSGLISGQRPYSRAAFARAAEEARARLQGEDGTGAQHPAPEPRFLEALERLEARFVSAHGAPGSPVRGATADASWVDSPSRAIRARYEGVPERIDADLNPLLQRNQGREVSDGGTLAAEAWGDIRLGSRFAAAAHPRVWLAAPPGGGTEAAATLVRGYARGLFGNLSVDVGRNTFTHGHARALGVALSDNARGLDMVRLSMERPARLPWILQHLGPVAFAGTLATLGDDRDNAGGMLVVWEASIRPHGNLEVGLTLLNQQGGAGAPTGSLGDRILDAFFLGKRIARPFSSFPRDPEFSDKLVGIDARLTLPGPRLEFYAEGVTTDDHDLFFLRPREALWTEAAWTGGVRVFGLGEDGRVDLWAEGGRNGVRPYTHHQYTSGLTLDRRILGSPLGPLATGFQGGVDWTGTQDRVSAAGAWERYHGDEYYRLYDAPMEWLLETDNPDEIRVRATLDWVHRPAVIGIRTTVRLGYEHVRRFDFTDRNRSNFLAQVGVGWVW